MVPYFVALIVRVAIALGLGPEPAEAVAERAGAACRYGCIVSIGGAVYEMTPQDIELLALLAKAESGPRFVRDESAATAWAMVQRFVLVNNRRGWAKPISLASIMRGYSAVLNDRWRTGGSKFHPRITPRADSYIDVGWDDLRHVWRGFAVEFAKGQVENRWPGVVHVLARGFEHAAADHLVGPFYATTAAVHPGGNAYYRIEETVFWTQWNVRIVPARARMRIDDALAQQDGDGDGATEGE